MWYFHFYHFLASCAVVFPFLRKDVSNKGVFVYTGPATSVANAQGLNKFKCPQE